MKQVHNDKKSEKLGMPHGTACSRLRKMILFLLVKETNRDVCFRCGKKIEKVEDLSIEHKIPWLNNSKELFWDLDNIAFSHLQCNRPLTNTPVDHRIKAKKGYSICSSCGKEKPLKDFSPRRSRWNGVQHACKKCECERDKKKRLKQKRCS